MVVSSVYLPDSASLAFAWESGAASMLLSRADASGYMDRYPEMNRLASWSYILEYRRALKFSTRKPEDRRSMLLYSRLSGS